MKRKEFVADIKKLEPAELKERARAIAEELMKLRFRNASGQFENGHRFHELKKNLARIKSLLPRGKAVGAGAVKGA